MSTGQALRDTGMTDVLAADASVTRDYASLVRAVVEDFLIEFTAEDIREVVEDVWPDAQPHSPNVLPAVLGSLASAGRIRAVGHTRCTRSSRRHGWMRVWQVTPRSAGGVTPAP